MKITLSAFLLFFSLMLASSASAGSASQGWNNNWGFQSPGETANVLSRALAMEFVKNGGYNINSTNNNSFFSEQNCNTDGSCFNGNATSIGNNIIIQGDENYIDSQNDGNVSSQNNNGSGVVVQDSDEFAFQNGISGDNNDNEQDD